MRAHRGSLGLGPGPGDEVFAASFLNQRRILFDVELLRHAPDFVNIFTHEIYHFVWRRLPNAEREAWSALLRDEKLPMHPNLSSRLAYDAHAAKPSVAKWKHYVCEAFCDTAAAIATPGTLVSSQRRQWLTNLTQRRRLPV